MDAQISRIEEIQSALLLLSSQPCSPERDACMNGLVVERERLRKTVRQGFFAPMSSEERALWFS